jgi:hypothetical protein
VSGEATPTLAPLLAALLLAAVHVGTPALRFLGGTPRSAWLSIAGGVSVAYVFVHLLPELAAGQAELARALEGDRPGGGALGYAERHVYLIALVGLVLFYGLDKLALRSRGQRPPGERSEGGSSEVDAAASGGVFAVHMASFSLYNLVIGYLLVHGERRGRGLALFAIAMALHFVVTDYGLGEHHRASYGRVGRWVLVAALGAGVAVGYAAALPEAAVAVLVAFLAGGVMLNVLKEEVPSERKSRYWAFAGGAAAYAALLLAL